MHFGKVALPLELPSANADDASLILVGILMPDGETPARVGLAFMTPLTLLLSPGEAFALAAMCEADMPEVAEKLRENARMLAM